MFVAGGAVAMSGSSVLLCFVMPPMIVVMRSLAMVVSGRFMMCGGAMMMLARRMLVRRHEILPMHKKAALLPARLNTASARRFPASRVRIYLLLPSMDRMRVVARARSVARFLVPGGTIEAANATYLSSDRVS
jgi:hypothetical protein